MFDQNCKKCKRLADFLCTVKKQHPDYHALPVAPYGAKKAKILIVGLAPGMHGANRTGRPFTGDAAGVLLYATLFKFGLANKPESVSLDDGFRLIKCKITNAVKCLPPQNKPTGEEVNICNQFLVDEIAEMPKGSVIIALGGVAHNAVLKAQALKLSSYKFAHAAVHELDAHYLVDSYHCSRYNTQTKRLTEKMFHDVFKRALKLAGI